MWLFVDESWSPDDFRPRFGVLFGVLVEHDSLSRLEDFLYAVRKKYFGVEHARDLRRDLKGKDLISSHVLNLRKQSPALPKNLCVVKEMLSFPQKNEDFFLRAFASTVYSEDDRRPDLLSPDPKQLARPFKHLIDSAAYAALERDKRRTVTLVFDQRLGAQEGLAISVKRFISGVHLRNIHPYPYFAVSNVSPGVQVADVFAHLMSKRAQGKKEVMDLFRDLMKLQWVSSSSPTRYGFARFDQVYANGVRTYPLRRRW